MKEGLKVRKYLIRNSKLEKCGHRWCFVLKGYLLNEHGVVIVLLFRQKDENHLPKPLLAHSLKIEEILAKKWALLRASPNGPRAVFAGFLCIFKFTGSAAPRLGGLTRCIERIFCVGRNIILRI